MTMTKTIARLAAAATAATAVTALAVGPPAEAATPTRVRVATFALAASTTQHFHLVIGASVTDGNIIFSARSVSIGGTVKAVSGPRTVEFVGYNGNLSCRFDERRTAAAGTTRSFGFSEKCDIAGGFAAVDVFFS